MIATFSWSLSNTVSVVTGIAAIVAIGTGIIQTRRMRSTWQAENALGLLRDMQSDAQRAARGCLFGLKGDDVPYSAWTEEQKHQADLVIQLLNTAAYLAQTRLLPWKMLSDLWGDIFRNAYAAAFDRIEDRRNLGDKNLWQSFTTVAEDLLKTAPAKQFHPTTPSVGPGDRRKGI